MLKTKDRGREIVKVGQMKSRYNREIGVGKRQNTLQKHNEDDSRGDAGS